MDIANLAIWIAILLTALGIVAILAFGIKSIVSGKFRMSSLLAMVIPVIVFAISYALSAGNPDPLAAAAVLTSVILIVLGFVAILIAGLRGFVGF
jgi:hypothetical protein